MDNIVNFPIKEKTNVQENLLDDYVEKEEFIIDMNKSHSELKSMVDELWNEIYCDKKLYNLFADDDGRIYYKSRWKTGLESEPAYEISLKESFDIAVNFINNNFLSKHFIDFYDKEVESRGILKLLVLNDKNEKSPTPDQGK